MGYKDFTQNVQTEDDQSIKIKERVDIKSQLLQQLRKTVTIYLTFNLVNIFFYLKEINLKIFSSFLRRIHYGIELD